MIYSSNDSEAKLIEDRARIVEMLDVHNDIATFSKTVLGKHTLARLRRDLEAVRKKYYHIKGTSEAIVAELMRNQGREAVLQGEVTMHEEAESLNKVLTKELAQLDSTVLEVRQIKKEQR